MGFIGFFSRDKGWEVERIYPKAFEDGQEARVLVRRTPAKFFRIEAVPGVDSLGRPRQGFVLGTGCGEASRDLAHRVAKAVSEGMLGLHAEGGS